MKITYLGFWEIWKMYLFASMIRRLFSRIDFQNNSFYFHSIVLKDIYHIFSYPPVKI